MSKTTTKAQDRIDKANAEFEQMTRPQRAVAVAKDALKLLDAGRIEAAHDYASGGPNVGDRAGTTVDLQALLANDPRECRACGIGALFIAKALKFNGVRLNVSRFANRPFSLLGQTVFREDVVRGLRKAFTAKELRRIECAFERAFDHARDADIAGINAFAKLGDSDRLRAIFANIVRNRGDLICTPEEVIVPRKAVKPARRKRKSARAKVGVA